MGKKPKILVEVIGSEGIKSRKKRVIEQNKVVIEKEGRGRGKTGWKPSFDKDCILYYRSGIFGKLKRKLMVKDGAQKCIPFMKENLDIPVFDRKASSNFFEAKVIKSAGETTQRVVVPIWLYLLLVLILLFVFLSFLVSTGRVYI